MIIQINQKLHPKAFPGILARFLYLSALLAIAAGCSGNPLSGAGQSSKANRPPLKVEWTYWDGDFTMLVAQEKGFFEKHGVKVEPQYYPEFGQAVPDLIAGRLDGGLFAVDNLINSAQRAPIKGVMVYDSGGTSAIVSTSAIQTIADLKGKRIGFSPGSVGEAFVREMLAQGGLSLRDIIAVGMEPEQVPDELGNKVEAAYAWEPYASQAVDKGNRMLYNSAESPVGSSAPDIIVFRQKVLDERPEDVRAFLSAWLEALDYRKAHPQEALEIASKHLGEPVEPSDANLVLYDLPKNQALFGWRSDSAIPRTIFQILDANLSFLINSGAVSRPPNSKDLMAPEFLPQTP